MRRFNTVGRSLLFLAVLGVFLPAVAGAVDLNVVGSDGNAVGGYRWLVEEDATYHVEPGVVQPPESVIRFHGSYMPAVAQGDATNSSGITLDPAKRYFVSVLPDAGYAMGGGTVAPGQQSVTIAVNKLPLPTAQITVFAFEDNHPINNSPDFPQEKGLAGFTVVLSDAGGRYGQVGGQLSLDAFGNPLGTDYNPDGSVKTMGSGVIKTDANGYANIKFLVPAKYGVNIVPPPGQGWQQTTTIEGTKTIDAWVKSNEPTTLVEFGLPSTHVFMGFVKPTNDTTVLNGRATITGQVVNFHFSRPPDTSLTAPTHPLTNAWVALNDAAGKGVFAQPCNPATGEFSIPNVSPGTYQIVIWDSFLDLIIAFQTVNVGQTDRTVNIGKVAVNEWFAHLWNFVYFDADKDGFPDELDANGFPVGSEAGMASQNINIRFRDGTVYQALATDGRGFSPLMEVFPFFNWLIAEVDFARFKATGATVAVDAGGAVNPAAPWTFGGRLTPQLQPENGGLPYRTETGPVLLEGFQGFAGLTNVIYWGKAAYDVGENGGISGIVFYSTTRAENDPRFAAGDPWEPGIPRVQVVLYEDKNNDGAIDDLNGDGPTLADVDNYPFGWADGSAPKGNEDEVRCGDGVTFCTGDAVQIATSDSWDDNQPTNCPGDPADPFYLNGKCYDGIRNFNQVRPAVFDGGYAFTSYHPGGIASGSAEVEGLPPGNYIVEAVPPRSAFGAAYKTVKEEDKNVDFGEEFMPSPLLVPAVCVNKDENGGLGHLIPQELSLFPGITTPLYDKLPYPQYRPVCDRKQVTLSGGQNAAADFFMYTDVPITAHYTGIVTNDLGNEFNPNRPNFIEKFGAPFIPVAFRDFNGREITRVYTDQWGLYNGIVPATHTVNAASPSGLGPQMLQVCINDIGPIPDPNNPANMIFDPFFRKEYTQSCYTFQFMTGTTTYLDTPVLQTTAWAGKESFPLDCEFIAGTPVIKSAAGSEGGAYVPAAGQSITIEALGDTTVPNPAYNPFAPVPGSPTIVRDFGFGADQGTGSVKLGTTSLPINNWGNTAITATVPAGTPPGRYQLMVTRGNGRTTEIGVTVTVGPYAGTVRHVTAGPVGTTPIQDAIDAAGSGDLILVHPGIYRELVVLYKNVQLQGSGAPGTIINAVKSPPDKIQLWRQKVEGLVAANPGFLLPNQDSQFSLFPNVGLFPTEQGPGILVLAPSQLVNGVKEPVWGLASSARIDGLTVTTADSGGAILLNGFAQFVEISNNKVFANSGIYGGGIRLGHPATPFAFLGQPVDAKNDNVSIHHNYIAQNGAIGEGGGAAGGGLSLYNGSDAYAVTDNYICGNFSIGAGAGIGHKGLSRNGLISRNDIIFNHSFHQTVNDASGGGIAIDGNVPATGLTAGTGSVTIDANLIQGNYAGAGDGGGIRLFFVNGQDVAASFPNQATWHEINILNNIIVNNMAGLAGAGISMKDAAKVNIISNTVAHNDSTATAGAAGFTGGGGTSTPQPAGIVSRAHSAGLASALRRPNSFADPRLENNIIWKNRSFYYSVAANNGLGGLLPDVGAGATPVYWDLAVLGAPGNARLTPQFCILTDRTGYAGTNLSLDPLFVRDYFNGNTADLIIEDRMTFIQAAAALDEGGNSIEVRLEPVTLVNPATGLTFGDYHIQAGSPAVNNGTSGPFPASVVNFLNRDYDGDPRPNGPRVDIGADELR